MADSMSRINLGFFAIRGNAVCGSSSDLSSEGTCIDQSGDWEATSRGTLEWRAFFVFVDIDPSEATVGDRQSCKKTLLRYRSRKFRIYCSREDDGLLAHKRPTSIASSRDSLQTSRFT